MADESESIEPNVSLEERLRRLEERLVELEAMARPFMHYAKGDCNQVYRGRYKLTLQEAGKKLIAYFQKKSIER